jgi:hypothetical protein
MARHQRGGGSEWLELRDVQPLEGSEREDWIAFVFIAVLYVALCVPAFVLRFQ